MGLMCGKTTLKCCRSENLFTTDYKHCKLRKQTIAQTNIAYEHRKHKKAALLDIGENLVRQRDITFDRFTMLSRKQGKVETMKKLLDSIREIAKHCKLNHLKQELIRDKFIFNMGNCAIQRKLLKGTVSPEVPLQIARLFEQSNLCPNCDRK